MKKLLIVLSVLVLIGCSPKNEEQQLLLISFDGFRADYLSKTATPNFDKLVKNGVTSEGLIPIFPTKTFPNHYAIATGLYPENNGLIGNNMYDPEMEARYSMGNRDAVENPEWYLGEPIWNTVEKAGKRAGTMFWIGSEAPIQDMRPTHWKSYDGSIANEARIDTVLKWLTREKEPVDLGTLYFSFVDSQGHRYGPDSEEVIESIKQADELVGYLMEKLEQLDNDRSVNLMIVSDHGMIEVSPSKKVILDNYIDVNKIEVISYSPALMFNVKEGAVKSDIYSSLKAGEQNYRIYSKEDIPERFHLKNNIRTPDFLMIAEEGYTINSDEYFKSRGEEYPSGGAHGFDNANIKMDALFIAHGPAFKNKFTMGRIENIHLYEVMAKILNVHPAPNDGDFNTVKEMLK
ncbi:MAG: alkaline phosphatase family protein [Balneola sp.]|jgi:ectonucleotide pyrophosphatase/phosphodiesterase family member 5|nr:alkaline phosphatase family protein [Balneola sp.]MAO77250.1 alkaline phosphatase family protein [Balneola sp.]MBF63036.1 alkaline phosphatase family protein [Balneola sp.]|tara:strand:+ start:3531 stop:4742 length:1212 start_codon:yes stop_codon:yes gene_type:complete